MKFKCAAAILLLGIVLIFTGATYAVENTWDYSVRVSATIQTSPATITLAWPQDTNGVPASYTISRKAPNSGSWATLTTLPGSTTSYTDTSVTAGTAYEYRVAKSAGGYMGYGYVQAGVSAPLVDNRGKVILIVDNTFTSSLASELAQLQRDLAGDGWTVIRHDVSRSDSAANVKNLIRADYNADPANVRSVFLVGHVPVPYSGNLFPDGHSDHQGAWPADVYYGDIDGSWTDSWVNVTQSLNTDPADAARLTNRPGDGKFDQTQIPSAVELEVGRVDLSNLPGRLTWGGPATFPNETELLRAYLNRDHNFRHRTFNPARRAILGDYFGARGGEAFAASGFRSFAPLVGANNIRNLNTEFNDQRGVWIPQAASTDYLLAYACGAGSYSSIAGIGNSAIYNTGTTTELVGNNVRGVFNLLFGSWLGDWDHEDSILRAPLATTNGLVSVWSGRPHWFMHPMGLGETVGYAARLTQNNNGLYETQINSSANRIHIALMGDPTLRLHPVAPVASLGGTVSGSSVSLTWGASPDSNLVGYHVYRGSSVDGPFTRLTSSPITALNFTDRSAPSGSTYMVRAIKLESTTSGSYLNASQGVFYTMGGSSSGTTTPTTTTPTDTTPTDTTTSGGTGTSGDTTTSGGTASGGTTTPTTSGVSLWFDDALPTGATGAGGGGDGWNWVSASPAPFSGGKAHQSTLGSGLHEHYFNWAAPMTVNSGEVLVTYVYLDPANTPTTIMLSWASSNWEHRAYWGANQIDYGTNNSPGRVNMGALPAAGQWVRLEVPAAAVGLDGAAVQGMCFSVFNGRATWDATGKASTATSSGGTTGTTPTSPTTTTPSPSTAVDVAWFDDSLPASASGAGTGGDGWNWISASPAPFSGSKAHQSNLAAGVHEHFFGWGAPMTVAAGDKLYAYVYLDPANVPSEIMLSWGSDNWEHRAYWGADRINYGTRGSAGRFYAGALPAAGQWVRLEVPASAVGLEGQTVTMMGFSLFDGRATWDVAGKSSGSSSTTSTPAPTPSTPPTTTTPTTTTPTPSTASDTDWFDDTLPSGAGGGGTGGDSWNWITSGPAPFSGARAHQSNVAAGLHEHFFNWANAPLSVAIGDKLYTYVYLDPANMPTEIMLSWNDGNWEHRAFWGADKINYGTRGTAGRYYAGALPAGGQWVRLEVPASAVALEGSRLEGMCFSAFDGRVTFDKTGKSAASSSSTTGTPPTTSTPSTTTGTEWAWLDDSLPAGASGSGAGGDSWNWTSASPAPFSGSRAHQSALASGLHEHYFNWATETMTVATGDRLYAYVYIDPANPPTAIMLSWGAGNWEHRAYWGTDKINYGTRGTPGRYYAGALPAAGQWVRLEVPASAVALEGVTVQAMGFSTFDGRVTYDKTGKISR